MSKISDCKWATEDNAQGQAWCGKKNIYVSGKESGTCEFYET